MIELQGKNISKAFGILPVKELGVILQMDSFTETWSLVCDYCKNKITKVAFQTWISRIEPKDIDFESLPEKFVIKCNHDSGSTHIIDKSKGFDEAAVRRDLSRCLKIKYGYTNGETFYNGIKLFRRLILPRMTVLPPALRLTTRYGVSAGVLIPSGPVMAAPQRRCS